MDVEWNPFSLKKNKGVLHKFVWADGQLRVTPNIAKDPGVMHHGDLLDQMGYNDPRSPLARDIIAGEFTSIFDPLEIEYQRGNVPDEESLKEAIQNATLPSHTGNYFLETIAHDRPKLVVNMPPGAIYPSVPFIHHNGQLIIDPKVKYHSELLDRQIDPALHDEIWSRGVFGRYHPDQNVYRLYPSGPDESGKPWNDLQRFTPNPEVEEALANYKQAWNHLT